jgi:hypothetical protein
MSEEKIIRHRTLTRKQVAKIPLSEEEHQNLIKPPKDCIEKYRKNEQDANDWYIVTFRIKLGLMVAKRDFTDEAIRVLENGLKVCMDCLAKYRENPKYNWSVLSLDFISLYDAIDLVEDIQRNTSRETLMFCTRKVYLEMIKFAEG